MAKKQKVKKVAKPYTEWQVRNHLIAQATKKGILPTEWTVITEGKTEVAKARKLDTSAKLVITLSLTSLRNKHRLTAKMSRSSVARIAKCSSPFISTRELTATLRFTHIRLRKVSPSISALRAVHADTVR